MTIVKKYLLNQAGMTFLELVMSSAALALSAQGLIASVQIVNEMFNRAVVQTAESRRLGAYAQMLIYNLDKMQVDSMWNNTETEFDVEDENGNAVVDPDTGMNRQVVLNYCDGKLRNLPNVYSPFTFALVADCPGCVGDGYGRVGWCATQVQGAPGMMEVVVRFQHPKISKGEPRNFRYVVSMY